MPIDNFFISLPNTDFAQHNKRRPMNRLKQTFSFRHRKKENSLANKNHSNKNVTNHQITGDSKPLQWQEDERSVRVGICSFHVKVRINNYFKYLGEE